MKTERQTYRPGNPKTVLMGLVSLAFVLSGILMSRESPLMGWFVAIFFGICLVVFLIQLIPGSTALTLTKEGFEMTSLYRKRMTRWTDIKAFKIGYLGRDKTIMFDFIDRHNEHQTGKSISKRLSGSHGALPTTYGLQASELLKIMNDWKNKYGERRDT